MYVKICGITRPEDARAAATAGAEFVGMIMAPSARQISLNLAREIIRLLPSTARPVLVFRNARVDEVLAAAATTGALWVQLHGHEPPGYVHALQQQRPGLRIIKGWEVASPQAGDELSRYAATAAHTGARLDVVILDAPKGGAHPGYEHLGDVARRCGQRPPAIWCAGGLTPGNVALATAVGCYEGVDVASGVETSPGIKDHTLVQRFVEAAHQL
jgi:phosphoribosylanthranilate isomerase